MALASNNEFPSLLIKEGSVPANPAAGDQRLYVDIVDHKLKRVNSAGGINVVEGGGGVTPAMVLISTQVVAGSPAAAVTFSSIPGTSTHLELVYQIRTNGGANANQNLLVQFNADTGANYDFLTWNDLGAAPSTAQTSIQAAYTAGGGATANYASSGGISIPNYAGTVFYKTVLAPFAVLSGAVVGQNGGTWKNTAAVTSIKLFLDANNLAVGSTFSLYGVT